MKSKKIALIIVAAFTTLSIFTGCASAPQPVKKSVSEYMNNYADQAEADEEVIAGANNNNFFSAGSRTASASGKKTVTAETNAAAPADAGNAGTNQDQSQTNIDPEKGRLLIRNVNISAETKEFDTVRQAVEDKIRELGGYVENSGVSGTGKSGSLRRASFKIRIPADKLDALISTVGSSCTVISSNESTTDVTLNYVDTKARLDSLRVEQKQLMELLSQAKDLDTIIVLQKRITEVRYQIESAESTLRVLENQVTYATLTLSIREVMEIKPQEAPHVDTYGERVAKTFKQSLHNIGEFFKNLFLVLVAVSPVLVPMIVITVIAVIIIVTSVKKGRKKRAAALAAKQAQYQAQLNAQAPVQAPVQAQPKAEEKKTEEKKEEKPAEKE
ncbi:MAG: DUF4349 domain-containing protein [Saccharofermentans sp.]|nr:DUF4349 domain-containing protein [Saccharofermentans sp.]